MCNLLFFSKGQMFIGAFGYEKQESCIFELCSGREKMQES